MNLQPPAALEFTESTEEKINLIRHCGSVSVLSNNPAAAGEWVVRKRTQHDVEKSTRPIYPDRQSGSYIQSELVNPIYAAGNSITT
jgi:hypothetical protein